MSKGVLTLAFGSKKFADMAVGLALSIRRNSPGQSLAIVTDNATDDRLAIFDYRIPLPEDLPRDLTAKLFLDSLTPFTETLFIDADCLVFKDLSYIWNKLSCHPFAAFGFTNHRS